MRIEKRSYSVLIVSGSDKSLDFISNSLPMELFYPTVSLNSAAEARRLLVNQDFDIVIINTPLKDDIGIELALEIAEKDFTAVMIIVKNEMFDQVAYRVEDYGVFCLSKPMSKERMLQTMRLMTAAQSKMMRVKKEKATLQSKMEEIRVVNRAKWVLIDQMSFSEPEAHRYIEKQAMDLCITRKAVAENILKTYEL